MSKRDGMLRWILDKVNEFDAMTPEERTWASWKLSLEWTDKNGRKTQIGTESRETRTSAWVR